MIAAVNHSDAFDPQQELGSYLNQLTKKGISIEHAQERVKIAKTIEHFQEIMHELLTSVVFPSLTQSGEEIVNEGILDAFFKQE